MQEMCFWNQYTQGHYIFCERQLCEFIQQPANTWSNIGYLIVAIMIFFSRRDISSRVRHLFSFSSFFLAFGSAFYHASGTLMGQKADVATMFVVAGVILSLAIERLFNLKKFQSYLVFTGILLISFYVLFVLNIGSPFFAVEILLAVFFEYLMRKHSEKINTKAILKAIAVSTVAFIIWILDVKKIVCAPDLHWVSGHAIWHLLTAMAIWFLFTAYEKSLK